MFPLANQYSVQAHVVRAARNKQCANLVKMAKCQTFDAANCLYFILFQLICDFCIL